MNAILTMPRLSVQPGRHGGRVCARRGFCGPFANQPYYDEFPGWEGYGDCMQCGSTVHTEAHTTHAAARG